MRAMIFSLLPMFSSMALSALPVPARADEAPDEPRTDRTKFYDFAELDIKGTVTKPAVLYTNAKERATFERLFILRRSLLPEIVRSGDGATLSLPPAAP